MICYYCGVDLTEETATRDHVIPKSQGGTDASENVVPCCLKCNREKADMSIGEFMEGSEWWEDEAT